MKEVEISKKFSIDVLELLLDCCAKVSSGNKSICSSYDILEELIGIESVKKMLFKLNIDYNILLQQLKILKDKIKCDLRIKKGKVIFSPDLRKTLLRSYFLAKKMSSYIVGYGELFLSILFSEEVKKQLTQFGYDIDELENLIFGYTSGKLQAQITGSELLQKCTRDITKLAKEGKTNEIVYRDQELMQLVRVLVRQDKNNVILVGEVGVGRSSIVELLAHQISSGNIVDKLRGTKILELNLGMFISLIANRNFNEFIETVVNEVQKYGNIIMFIKNFEVEINQISYEKFVLANMIKSLLSSGQVKFILTMTNGAYKNFISKDPDFASYFEIIKVSEPSCEVAIKILKKVASRISNYHKLKIGDEVIVSCVELSKRYITDKLLPSKAIDILDEACSKVTLEGKSELTVEDVKNILSEKTGIPIEKLTIDEQKKLIDLENLLNSYVIGQEEAVHVVSEVVRRSRAGLKDPKKPIGSFLFLGPSGVGKTYFAKNLAKIVYDSENAMIRLDMSEFSESHTVQRLIGSPPGYVGYEEGGQLTNPVWQRPYSLILLDEIEKAHPKVFDIFLQVLDEGRLTDGQGRTVDFTNTIIIATSNIASDEILSKMSNKTAKLEGFDRERFYEEEILPLLKMHFRPEFVNRFDEIVVFNPLTIDVLKTIAKIQIQKVQERLKDKKITLNVSDQKLTEFAEKSYNPAFVARPLIRLIQEQVENVLARKIIGGEIKEGDVVNI